MQKKQSLLHSFGHAFNGMFHFFLKDRNGEIHLFSALLACASGIYFGLSEGEWLAISFCIGLVIALEMVNAAIEQLCNLVHAEYHPIIKKVKDMCAAAVLWAAIMSAVTGCIIFIPKIIQLTGL
ncbi:MAG TPA: diacylglycerol kinase family protein [Panacibacter sp.]|mgnify:CR=1 FL=1|nr:diacylglycerol kinase family protein [Panacibacter sp.]HNP46726.1 diacylglycerol kinase family protein [Panacibacter sp.]